jgi:hypothetical protein
VKQINIFQRWLVGQNRLKRIIVLSYAFLFIFVVLCLGVGWPGGLLGAVLGWFVARWSGAAVGLLVGSVLWLILWLIGKLTVTHMRTNKARRKLATYSTEQLRKMVAEPASPEVGFAIVELDRRGIEARPSLESLFPLLTSPDVSQRTLGMWLLDFVDPPIDHHLLIGASNSDSPEVWRERLARLRESQEHRLD